MNMFMSLVDDLVTKNNLEGLELWTGPQIRIFLSYLQGVNGKITDKIKVSWINLTPTISTALISNRNSGGEHDCIGGWEGEVGKFDKLLYPDLFR